MGRGDKKYPLFQIMSLEYSSYIDNAPIDECKTKVFFKFFNFLFEYSNLNIQNLSPLDINGIFDGNGPK